MIISSLNDYLRSHTQAIENEIRNIAHNQLIDTNKDLLSESLTKKFQIPPLILNWNEAYSILSDIRANRRGASPQHMIRNFGKIDVLNQIEYHIPCSGNPMLLRLSPMISYACSLPEISTTSNEIIFKLPYYENAPDQTEVLLNNHKQWLNDQVNQINNDLSKYNPPLESTVKRFINKRLESFNKLQNLHTKTGIPLIMTTGNRSNEMSRKRIVDISPTNINNEALGKRIADKSSANSISAYLSCAISCGAPDEPFAKKLKYFLTSEGVNVWLFSEDAEPGKKLHRMMFEVTNDYDRVLLICSKESLNRPGVLYEIEQSLAREAAESEKTILIPIATDDYVFNEWNPVNQDIATQIRRRVIGRINSINFESAENQVKLDKLLFALKKNTK